MIINVESEETISRLETGVTFSEQLWIVSLQKQIAWYQFVFSLICSVTVNTNRASYSMNWSRHWLASYYLVLLTNDGCFQQCVYNNVSSSSGVTLHSVHQDITPPPSPQKVRKILTARLANARFDKICGQRRASWFHQLQLNCYRKEGFCIRSYFLGVIQTLILSECIYPCNRTFHPCSSKMLDQIFYLYLSMI